MLIFNKLKPVVMGALISLTLVACGGTSKDKTVPEVFTSDDYQQMIDKAISDEIPGIVLLVETPQERFLGSAGEADIETHQAMQTYDVMPTGAAGQKLIGLLTVMLAQDGLLDLDAPVDTWLSEEITSKIDNTDLMTLRQLLNHQSGVLDFNSYDRSMKWYDALLYSDNNELKTDFFPLSFAFHKSEFCEPGNCWIYSDAGYALIGYVLTAVLGEHPAAEIRRRILEPLGMNASYYSGVEKDFGDIISGYYHSKEWEWTRNTKVYYENMAVTNGPLNTTVEDLALLLKAIVSENGLIDPDIREIMIGEDNMNISDYNRTFSMGIYKEVINGKAIYFGNGDELGYSTVNIYIPESDTSITAFFNGSSNKDWDPEYNKLINKILLNALK